MAVRHSDNIGISAGCRYSACRSNSWTSIRARRYVGTARRCRFGVFIVFPSRVIRNRCEGCAGFGLRVIYACL